MIIIGKFHVELDQESDAKTESRSGYKFEDIEMAKNVMNDLVKSVKNFKRGYFELFVNDQSVFKKTV